MKRCLTLKNASPPTICKLWLQTGLLLGIVLTPGQLLAQPGPTPSAPPPPWGDLIQIQEAPSVSARLMEEFRPDLARIVISLGRQRAYLLMNDQIVIDSPISSGRKHGETPTGEFTIVEKLRDHRSNNYGNLVDAKDRVVHTGISAQLDAVRNGTRFVPLTKKYLLSLDAPGVGIHDGDLPGFPAADRSIRLPEHIAEMFFTKVVVGTKVSILP
ncbi:MAG: L,D-transpeptidase [Verrucomicrobiia bacterium]